MKLFDSYPVLENDTVLLRKLTAKDAPALKALTDCEEMYRTLPTFLYEKKYPDPYEVIARMDGECFQTKESLLLGIFQKTGDRLDALPLIGIAEIYGYEENKEKASMGYRLHPSVWGRGIAKGLNELLKNYLLKEIGLRTITGHILRSNRASAVVAEKCGFVNKYPGLWEDWGFGDLQLTDKYVFKREWLMDDASSAPPLSDAEKVPPVEIERFTADYAVPAERIGPFLPEGFRLLEPVLRIVTEILTQIHKDAPAESPADIAASVQRKASLEINTAAVNGKREGWLNLLGRKSTNDPLSFDLHDREVTITTPFLSLTYVPAAEPENTLPDPSADLPVCLPSDPYEGCFYVGTDMEFRPAYKPDAPWETCAHSLGIPESTFSGNAAGAASSGADRIPSALAEALMQGQLLAEGILRFRRG